MTYTVTPAVRRQRREARTTHGAQSGAVVVPLSRNVKQSILKRMGMRQAELSWAARETLDLYARNKAKLIALDRYFENVSLLGPDGTPNPATKIYWLSHNSAIRALSELRNVIEAMAKEDRRFDRALSALAAEGRRVREAKNGSE